MADIYRDEVEVRTTAGVVTLNVGYEHYKGGLYFTISVAKNVVTEERLVVYRERDTSEVLARPVTTEDQQGWLDYVRWPDGVLKPRFMKTTWHHFTNGGKRKK